MNHPSCFKNSWRVINIKVYQFLKWNSERRHFDVSRTKLSLMDIRRLGGEPIVSTEEEIDPTDRDEHGHYDPGHTERPRPQAMRDS